MKRPKVPELTDEQKRFLDEALTDLMVSKKLASDKSEDMKRRRLFFLQQAIEKCVKGTIASTTYLMRVLPESIAAETLFRGKDMRKDPATLIVVERFKAISERYSSPKALGHDPAAKLQIKQTLEDFYLFARALGLDERVTKLISEAVEFFDEKDVLKILDRIKDLEARRTGLREESKKVVASGEQSIEWNVRYLIIPSFVLSVLEACLYIQLLARLTDYEQSSRYPMEKIPESLLENLDRVEWMAETMIEFASELGRPVSQTYWDKLKT